MANVAATALDEANRQLRGHPYAARIRKALIEAGIVESGLRNLSYGDRDSQGFLQQRPSQGWGSVAQVRDVRHATRSFIARAKPIAGQYKTAGQLAQAVQRSAFPGRYDAAGGRARSILKGSPSPGGSVSASGGGTGAVAVPGIPGSSGGVATQQLGSTAAADALVQSLQPPPQPPLGAIPTPAVMAGPVLPTVRGVPSPSAPSFGPPALAPDVQDTIRAAAALRRDVPATAQQDSGVPGVVVPGSDGSGGSAAGGKRGKVSFRAGADRPGVKTKPQVIRFLEQVAGIAGHPIVVGTGTNHQRLTASGRVSDHYGGEAADTPARGRRLIQLGQAALIAAGMDPKKARKQRGGLFNIGRYQIIFNTNGPGIGDHTDHLHTGVR